MGAWVVDPYDGPPVGQWGLTINTLNSLRFRDVSSGFISGQSVCSVDDEVQISFEIVSATRLDVRIRESDTAIERYVLDIVIEALDPANNANSDPHGLALPVPNGWSSLRDATTVDWELYNCRVHSVKLSNP